MSIYIVYEPDGTIVSSISCSEEEIELNIDQGQLFMTADIFATHDTQYVSNNAIVDKTEFPDLTVSSATIGSLISITNIPVGSKVRWPDNVITLEDDGELSFTVNVGGDYSFEFKHPLYVAKRLIINVS